MTWVIGALGGFLGACAYLVIWGWLDDRRTIRLVKKQGYSWPPRTYVP